MRAVEALAFHSQLIALFGGADGLRDLGLLESALARPRKLFAYARKKLSLADLAGAYAAGICGNHPFIDGNKRVAMLVSLVFLEVNGFPMAASQEEAYLTFMKLAAGEITERDLAAWFKEHKGAA